MTETLTPRSRRTSGCAMRSAGSLPNYAYGDVFTGDELEAIEREGIEREEEAELSE